MKKERQANNERPSGSGEAALLAIFMKDVRKFPILTRAEEAALIVDAAAGDKAAEDRLVASSLRFVVKVALAHWGAVKHHYPSLSPMDLIQDASIGLLHAIRKCDPSFETRLLTYAGYAIGKGIAKAIVDCRRHQCDSLDAEIPGRDDETFLDRLPSDDESADVTAFHAELLDLLKRLKAREKTVIEERFLKDRTLNEVGVMLGATAEIVRRIETKALFRLRWAVVHEEPFFAGGREKTE
ncbi:MAG: sigma-70 family RNA polymerase sigma factor [Syntrophorhabdales bacterium]|jgi:RNA polymerase sigma factor (sigma-70 family)